MINLFKTDSSFAQILLITGLSPYKATLHYPSINIPNTRPAPCTTSVIHFVHKRVKHAIDRQLNKSRIKTHRSHLSMFIDHHQVNQCTTWYNSNSAKYFNYPLALLRKRLSTLDTLTNDKCLSYVRETELRQDIEY